MQKKLRKVDWKSLSSGLLIGVDEVGRGCLAGPVCSAAVILRSNLGIKRFTDSKLLSPERRKELSTLILENHKVGIGFASVQEVDQINILQASLLSMKRAVEALGVETGTLLIDGNQRIPGIVGYEQMTFVKGDLRVAPISAASIVAKVARDELMENIAKEFPEYGFQDHKGYATQEHRDAIIKWGPCRLHRLTFKGVKEFKTLKTGLAAQTVFDFEESEAI
ncbi:MAG: ribonuclease HII [Pseudobdellovibrionaceae bacterium]